MKRWFVGTVCAVSLLAGCGGSGQPVGPGAGAPSGSGTQQPSAGKVKLTMFIWAGSNQGVVPREVVAKYLQTHSNVEIELLESNNTITYPKMVAAKKTTPDQPLVHFGFFNVDSVSKGIVDDMWEPVNYDNIPNAKNTMPSLQRADKKAIPYEMSVMGLMYNKEKVKTPPTSWADLWSPEYKGKVTTIDYQWYPLIMAAKLNGGGEQNIEPGFKLWSEHAGQFKALVDSNDAVKNLVVSGDALIAPWFASISHFWMDEGAPLGYVTPKEGPIGFPLYLGIVKGITPEQRKVAEEIINELLSAENAGRYAELTYSIPAVTNAKVSDKVMNDPGLSPANAEKAIQLDWETMSKNNAAWKQRWDKEVKSKLK